MPQKFTITAPRYVQQVGQARPEYVHASPQDPAEISLPDEFVKSKKDFGLHAKKPDKPKPAHAEVHKDPVKKSHEAEKAKGEVRAADK